MMKPPNHHPTAKEESKILRDQALGWRMANWPRFKTLDPGYARVNQLDNQGVIIGGIAASLSGQPRFSTDLDAVILLSTNDLPSFIKTAAREGMISRIADAAAFTRKNRGLLLQHASSGITIEIRIGILRFKIEMIEIGQ